VRDWLPVLAYLALIFGLSSIANLAPPKALRITDKTAHLLEYAGLGWLLARACWDSRVLPWRAACALVAVIAGFTIGLADELYQIHVPGRVSDAIDFTADSLGVLLGVLIHSLFFGRSD
jgi:VanZ family protein